MDGPAPSGMAARRTRTARALIALLTAIVALLTACGERRVGWGVVLWALQDGIGGSVLSISDESDIQDVYRYTDAETVREIARWRVRLFTDRQQAEAFAASYRDLVHTFGYAARNGLPIREAADAGSAQLYRLREGEAVKIIGRGDGPVTVGDYSNFWYRVLTADGTQGFTFGEFLLLFETGEDPQAAADRLLGEEAELERITGVAWRPQYYADMLLRRRIDLTRLNDTYGFTVEPGVQTVPTAGEVLPQGAGGLARMRLPELDLAFAFDRIDRIGDEVFVLHGSGVRIVSETEWSIMVSFQHEGRLQTQKFVVLDADVDDLIAAEQERRTGSTKRCAKAGRRCGRAPTVRYCWSLRGGSAGAASSGWCPASSPTTRWAPEPSPCGCTCRVRCAPSIPVRSPWRSIAAAKQRRRRRSPSSTRATKKGSAWSWRAKSTKSSSWCWAPRPRRW